MSPPLRDNVPALAWVIFLGFFALVALAGLLAGLNTLGQHARRALTRRVRRWRRRGAPDDRE